MTGLAALQTSFGFTDAERSNQSSTAPWRVASLGKLGILFAFLLLYAWPLLAEESVAPPSSGGSVQVTSQGDRALLRYSNGSSVVQYTWQCPNKLQAGETTPGIFGPISLQSSFGGRNEGAVDIHSSGSLQWTQPMTLVHSAMTASGQYATCQLEFRGASNAAIHIRGTLVGPTLQLDITADQRIVKKVEFPSLNMANQQAVRVPYANVHFGYFPDLNIFGMQVLDWIHTDATSQSGMTATYAPLTNGTYNLVKERAFLSVGDQLDGVFPHIPNPPSPFIQLLAGRIVVDFWGGSFQGLRSRIENMGSNGIRDGVMLIHDWGFAGYDMKSPLYRPANPAKGGDAELNKAIQSAFKYGNLVALHQNYVDYYSDYPSFKASDIALESDGSRQKAWYNKTAQLQSYWTRPAVMLAEAETDGRGTYDEYKTNASYIDVNSSFPPGRHVDMDAGQPGAGMLVTFDEYSAKLWQAERDIHHGPVFGEGDKHWTWSGLLDGVEAQFGAGIPNNQGPQAPLLVDFDLMRIHPLQVNHGMGYYARWSPTLSALPDNELDIYRAQEVAFGHAPFLDKTITTGQTNLYSVNEYSLVTPVAKRYGAARVASIKYYINGRWMDISSALKSGAKQEQLQTVLVAYDNGLQVLSNVGPQMRWNNYDIPQNGWVAQGNGVTAGTLLKGGALVDFVDSPEEIYAHVREASLKQEQEEMLQPTQASNSRPVVDFGPARTNGIALLTHDNQGWMLYTLPQSTSTTLSFKTSRVAAPAEVKCNDGASGSAKIQRQGEFWTITLIPKCDNYKW